MNFDDFGAIHTYSDLFVWYVGIPVALVCCLLFMWPDLVKLVRKISRMALVHRIVGSPDVLWLQTDQRPQQNQLF